MTNTMKIKISISVKETNVPKLEDDEKYSNWKANIKHFRYKLDENLYNGSKIYNYKSLLQMYLKDLMLS